MRNGNTIYISDNLCKQILSFAAYKGICFHRHPVFCRTQFTYQVLLDDAFNKLQKSRKRESPLLLDSIGDTNYFGLIAVEKPGHVFNYTVDGEPDLSIDETEEIILRFGKLRTLIK